MKKLAAFLLLGIGCDNSGHGFVSKTGTISGQVVKGPVSGATVTIYEARTVKALGSTTADEAGRFTIDIGTALGDMRVCATGGVYIEEATGTAVELGQATLCAWVLDVKEASSRTGVVVTPWTQLVTARTQALVSYEGVGFRDAVAQAVAELEGILACAQGDVEILDAPPVDPTVPAEIPGDLTPAMLSGILLGGLSHQALMMSEARGLTPGVSITALSLTTAYSADLAGDGLFDGFEGAEPLVLEGYTLDSSTFRSAQEGFAQGIRGFLLSERNATGVAPADVHDLLSCIATAGGALFPDGASGDLDLAGPVLTFGTPAEGAALSGVVSVQVSANDISDIELLWLEPVPGLTPGSPVIEAHSAELFATLLTASAEDGPFTLTARARDVLGNVSEQARLVSINNNAPTIVLDAPSPASAVSGVQTVTATALDPQGIESLEVLLPAGLEDLDPSPDVVHVSWDTAVHVDGTFVVELRASDLESNTASAGFPLLIDNNEPGSATGVISLDSPVADAKLQIFEYADGVRGGLLASANASSDGFFSVALPDSYAGPILLRAYGAGATFLSTATMEPVTFGADDELTLVVEYVPSPAGTHLESLALNVATTLATDLATRLAAQGTPFDAARDMAYTLVAEHMQRPSPFDLATAIASDFTGDPVADEPGAL